MSQVTTVVKTILPLVIFVVIGILLWQGLSQNPHLVPSPFIGKPVPAFRASALEQPETQLTNQIFKGHVSLLNVFATWCVSCRAEHPTLMDIRESHRVNIYGLNYKDQRAKAIKWLAEYGNPYTKIIYDPTGAIGLNLGVYGTPETFVIDRRGIIRYKYIGPISPTEWQDTVKPEIIKLERG